WGDAGMKFKDGSGFGFAFLIGYCFLTEPGTNQCEHGAIHAGTRLDYMRHEMLASIFVKILKRFAAGFLMLREIIVCSVGDSFQLLHTKREVKFNVVRALGIMGAFFGRNSMNMQEIGRNSYLFIEFQTFL